MILALTGSGPARRPQGGLSCHKEKLQRSSSKSRWHLPWSAWGPVSPPLEQSLLDPEEAWVELSPQEAATSPHCVERLGGGHPLPKIHRKAARETRTGGSRLRTQPNLSSPSMGPAWAWPGLHTVWPGGAALAESSVPGLPQLPSPGPRPGHGPLNSHLRATVALTCSLPLPRPAGSLLSQPGSVLSTCSAPL